jgi:hypothetical protein
VTRLLGCNIGEWQFDSREENFHLVQTDSGVKTESYPIGRTLRHRAEVGRYVYLTSSACTVLKFGQRLAVTSLIPSLHCVKLWDKHTVRCCWDLCTYIYIYICFENTEIQMLICHSVYRHSTFPRYRLEGKLGWTL